MLKNWIFVNLLKFIVHSKKSEQKAKHLDQTHYLEDRILKVLKKLELL